jgi:hypothetical protein
MFRRSRTIHGDVNELMVKIDQILNEVQALKNRAGELIFLVSLSIHLIRVQ